MGNKIKKLLTLVIFSIIFGSIHAAAITETLFWTGQGSVTEICTEEEPYMLWIFETGPWTLGSPNPVLYIGATKYDNGINKGATWHFNTSYYDPATLPNNVYVEYNVTEKTHATINLVISHGCSSIPEFPTVALPVAAVIGLVFFFQQRKKKEE